MRRNTSRNSAIDALLPFDVWKRSTQNVLEGRLVERRENAYVESRKMNTEVLRARVRREMRAFDVVERSFVASTRENANNVWEPMSRNVTSSSRAFIISARNAYKCNGVARTPSSRWDENYCSRYTTSNDARINVVPKQKKEAYQRNTDECATQWHVI